MSNSPSITFVLETINIRGHDDFSVLDISLASIRAQSIPESQREVLVVVDPLAQPRLSEYLRRTAPDVRVVEAPDTNYYAQKNLGARLGKGHIVGLVDADCDLVPGWAQSIVSRFSESDDRVAVVVGRYDTPGSATSAFAQIFLVTLFGHQLYSEPRSIESIAASNCALRREDLVAKPFDEEAFFHGPDVRYAADVRAAGRLVLLEPAARNYHDRVDGFRALFERGSYWGYCFLNARRKHGMAAPKYARLFRSLWLLGPVALVPAKAIRDIRQLLSVRGHMGLSLGQTLRCSALVPWIAMAAGIGAARYVLGLAPPPAEQTIDHGHSEKARSYS